MLALTLVQQSLKAAKLIATVFTNFCKLFSGKLVNILKTASLLQQFGYTLIAIKYMFILLILSYIPTALTLTLWH
jgi:hypothetical protein